MLAILRRTKTYKTLHDMQWLLTQMLRNFKFTRAVNNLLARNFEYPDQGFIAGCSVKKYKKIIWFQAFLQPSIDPATRIKKRKYKESEQKFARNWGPISIRQRYATKGRVLCRRILQLWA